MPDWTRRLHLRHFQWLLSLAETGSLSETARLVHTTQPGLSKWLKELEQEAGCTLFERHARGLRPSPGGQALLLHAQRIVHEMQRARQALDLLREGGQRQVLLGSSPAAVPGLVPQALLGLMRQCPGTSVVLSEGTMDRLLDGLEHGRLDIVVGRLDQYRPRPGLNCELLYSEPVVVIARPGHPLHGRDRLAWEALYDYDWVVWPPGTPIRNNLDTALMEAGRKPPRYRIESSSLLANLSLLRQSDLLSVASAHVARHFIRQGLLIRLPLTIGGGGSLGMCWRETPPLEESVTALLACLRAAAIEQTGEDQEPAKPR